MQPALFRRWRRKAGNEEAWFEAGEIAMQVAAAHELATVAVTGRVTVDSSPHLRSAILDLLRRGSEAALVIDFSAVTYLDMSGIATLLEALKAAREHTVKLRLAGMAGDVRSLAEITQLDKIFRTWGSEVEFL